LIYLDSSVALAHILTEKRRPGPEFWLQPTASSRLLQFEVWNRLHARQARKYRHERARGILRRIEYVELGGDTHLRALQPFPVEVRTLDGLHLAAMDHLRTRGASITLASYDVRLLAAANAMGFLVHEP
jgi:hypothetical protein